MSVRAIRLLVLASVSWMPVVSSTGVAAPAAGEPAAANAPASSANRASLFDGIWQKDGSKLRFSDNPPFTHAAKVKFEHLRPQDDPGARCVEPGIGRMMSGPSPIEMIATNNHLLLVGEGYHTVRRIWTDETKHDPDYDPGFYGESIVSWDGDTMVVDTTFLNGKNYLDNWGYPMSDAMHIVERWKLLDHNKLQIEYTFDDPKNYTKPWTSTILYSRHSDYRLGEYSCTENNRNNPADRNTPKAWTSTDKPAAYVERPGTPGR